MGVLLSIPIAIMYNLFISKINHMLTEDLSLREKMQRELVIGVIAGIVALIVAFTVFGNKKMENKIAKYGLILGGVLLLLYSVIYNWDSIENVTKLIVLFTIMVCMIGYSYSYIKKTEDDIQKEDLDLELDNK